MVEKIDTKKIKKELFESIIKKSPNTTLKDLEEKYSKLYNNRIEELKEYYTGEELILQTIRSTLTILKAEFRPKLLSNAIKTIGVNIGYYENFILNQMIDLVCIHSKKIWDEDNKKAIQLKICDSSGKPLWHAIPGVIRDNDKRIGRAVYLQTKEEAYSGTLVAIRKRVDEEGALYKKSIINLYGKKRNINIFESLNKRSEMMLNYNKNKSDDEFDIYNQSVITEINIIDEKEVPLNKLVKKPYLKDCNIKIEDLKKWYDEYMVDINDMKRYNRFVIFEGDVIDGSISTDINISNRITIDSLNSNIEGGITCWLPQNINVPPLGAIGVYIVGKPTYNERREQLSVQVYGLYIPEAQKRIKPLQIIPEENIEENEKKDIKLIKEEDDIYGDL